MYVGGACGGCLYACVGYVSGVCVGYVKCECLPVWGVYVGGYGVQCVCMCAHVFKISK